MKLPILIWFRSPRPALYNSILALSRGFLLFFFITGCFLAFAKEGPAAAVILFDGPQGAAYIQITGITLNGKTDGRVCDGVARFNRDAYDALPHAGFAGATSLQRGTDGTLTLTINAKSFCVLPGNLKFDKKPVLTPAEAADQAVLQGEAISSSLQDLTIPPFKAGVQVVFIGPPNIEQAEFLRAQRAGTLKDWQDFAAHHPSFSSLSEVKNSIAGLHQKAAENAFAQYQKSSAAHKPDIASLRTAYSEAQAATQAVSGYGSAVKLMESITRELDGLLDPDRRRLQVFRQALQDHTTGYSELVSARQDLELLVEVRPDHSPAVNLLRDVAAEEKKFHTSLAGAESLSASGRFDESVTALGPYITFAPEVPSVSAIVSAAYKYHFDNGQRSAARQEWEPAVAEFRKALNLHADSKDADAALKNAQTQLAAQRDQQEANLAILQSNEYAGKSQFVEAYNVLADLSETQRTLVKSQLATLAGQYVPAATRRAQKLQEGHIPIKDRSDEDALREAYVLLDRASSLTGDPAITLKRDFLSNKISSYYVDQASRYLGKPSGSGAGVGWLYLKEAQRYGITNVNTLKDQMTQYGPLYQRRARLSIGILLRDQTSRRDSNGFADQLADAIANAFDSSGIAIDVVRKPADASDPLQPNFLLVGEVLEHRVMKNTSLETPLSKYRAGTHEVKNLAWMQANSDYASAQQQLGTAQKVLADAQSQHKKKEVIAAASDAVQQAQKHSDDLRRKLDSIDQTRLEIIIEPYHYTRKSVDLTASIDLAVRLNDRSGNLAGLPVTVHKENHKTALVVQDVKPEDTEGVTNQSVEPDEVQFLTDLEIEARNALVKAIREKAAELPSRILQDARARVQRGDLDGAAEQYVMYLNATPATSSPERSEAAKFLHDRFNLAAPIASKM